MSNLLKGLFKGQTPSRVAESTAKHLDALRAVTGLESPSEETEREQKVATLVEKLKLNLKALHMMLYGDPDTDPNPDTIAKLTPLLLTEDPQGHNLIYKLSAQIGHLDFESKKQAADVLNYVFRRCTKNSIGLYLQTHPDIIHFLLYGFEDQKLAQHVGSVLQEIAKRPELAPILLRTALREREERSTSKIVRTPLPTETWDEEPFAKGAADASEEKGDDEELQATDVVTQLFIFAKNANLIIASDAFDILNILFTKHSKRAFAREYIEQNFEQFFQFFNDQVMTDNYVTQGKFLKLLADILLAKSNKDIRTRYVGCRNNLRICMTLLRSSSKLISHEAFHILKVFVANPNKTEEVHIILWKNKDRLVKFLSEFQTFREDTDKDFKPEKEIVFQYLNDLGEPPSLVAKKKEILEKQKSKKLLETASGADQTTAREEEEEEEEVPDKMSAEQPIVPANAGDPDAPPAEEQSNPRS